MNKFYLTLSYIIIALAAAGCAKTETIGPNDANQRYFEAWMHINHPDATPTGLGIYVIDNQTGAGAKVGEKGFILLDYKATDLDGIIGSYTDMLTAQQMGEYSVTNYYGPKFLTTTETTLPAGLRNAVVGQPVGTYRKVIIPSWLMSYKAYDSEEDYLNPPTEKGEDYDASSFTNAIYEFTIRDYTEDINKWQIDSIGKFFRNNTVLIDGKPAADVFRTAGGSIMTAADSISTGFYYKQIKAPTDTISVKKDTTIYINYVGKLLNGLVFDTNIGRVAKDNYLYSSTKTYSPVLINCSNTEADITMGTDANDIIVGFAKTIMQMKSMEKGVGVFFSDYGYGYSGSGSSIPAYSPLIFEIELVAKPEE